KGRKKLWPPLCAAQFPWPQAARISLQAIVARCAARVCCRQLEAERTQPHGKREVESGWIGRGPRSVPIRSHVLSGPLWLGLEEESRSFEPKRQYEIRKRA